MQEVINAERSPPPKQVDQLNTMVGEYPLVPELVELLVATERLPGFRTTFLANLHALLRLRGSRPDVRLTARQLESIRHPTLMFWGEHEPFGSPEVGRQMAALMPDAEVRVLGGGHAPWLTQAERIGPEARRFLHRYA